MTAQRWRITLADVVIGDEERRAVDEVLRSGWLSLGPRTERFERALGEMLGSQHVLAVTNGTAAIHLAAAALGLGPGDEVIVPALTFVASAAAIRQTGASVVLGDSTSLDDFALDPAEIDRLAGPRTRAVVVLHYGGYPADTEALLAAANRYDLLVIEDAAHAIGAGVHRRACGTFGDAGCFSFFPNKNMTTGEGGAVVLRDGEAAKRARRLRSHAMTTMTWDRHRGHASSYDVVDLGFNYRIDELRAALGLAQLARLGGLNAARAKAAERYRGRLAESARVSFPSQGDRGVSAHHLAVVLAESRQLREQLRTALTEAGIQTSLHYPLISRFAEYVRDRASVPRAEEISDRALTLPLHPRLTEADVDLVCDAIFDATGEA
jgi:dTDP-4-amino-4,6-dideoxygalactose transaminase